MVLGGQSTEFYMHEHLPFLPVAPYSTAWFWLSDRSLISQATPFADHSVGRMENCWKTRSFALFAALVLCCNMSPHCVRAMGVVCRALALFGDAKQAMGEGKSGPVETGLTGPVATALMKQCKLVNIGTVLLIGASLSMQAPH